MEKTKKILMITSLSCLAISCLMLILAVFGVPVFSGVPLRILLVISTLAIACGLAIGEISVIKRNKILGYVSIGFLEISVLFALIVFCTKLLDMDSLFNKITATFGILSVLFIFIVSTYTKLGKSMLALQIPTYIVLIMLDLFFVLMVFGMQVFKVAGLLELFIILIILSVGLLIATSVVASKRKDTIAQQSISKGEEISNLKKLVEQLQMENENLRKENENLKSQLEK